MFSVKSKELCALGYFVKKFSYLIEEALQKEIKAVFWMTFQKEILNPSTSSQKIISGFFKGFMYYCEIYKLRKENDDDNKIIQKIYIQIKNLAIISKEKARTVKIGNRGNYHKNFSLLLSINK